MLTEIIKRAIKEKVDSEKILSRLKRQAAFEFKQPIPDNIKLLEVYRRLSKDGDIKQNETLEKILQTRKVRTLSGVAVITVLTKPYPCPGQCLYCPDEKGMPKSYLSNEPAAMRAALNKFDPNKQVQMRLQALAKEGHITDKIELIVLGGTWSAYPKKYQDWFIKQCFDACNLSASRALKQAQKINEKAKHRIVGLTLETRPDHITPKEIKRMRELGCTRVELGVQSIYDDVLKFNRRKHNVQATIEATKLLKNAGFKVNYHMMLNLPGSNLKKDEKMFGELFNNPNFQPDLLKIYPCVVLKNSPLYRLWKKGGYQPYSDKQLINLLLKIKKKIPPYVRIQRIVRDIPKESIIAGNKISNLRQIIDQKKDKICQCIRCREIKSAYSPNTKLKLFRHNYSASGGQEIFLSFEDLKRKNLYALLRLRLLNKTQPAPLSALDNTALIRELHTYGELVPIGKKEKQKTQHLGLGKKLMAEAEKIVKKETNLRKIAVISGIGVRAYYRKLGYKLEKTYMIKKPI